MASRQAAKAGAGDGERQWLGGVPAHDSEPRSGQDNLENSTSRQGAEPGLRRQHTMLIPSSHLVLFSPSCLWVIIPFTPHCSSCSKDLLSARNCPDLGNVKIKDSILAHKWLIVFEELIC